jgi:hypothetical protein
MIIIVRIKKNHLLSLNNTKTPIVNKYREGKVKRTLLEESIEKRSEIELEIIY